MQRPSAPPPRPGRRRAPARPGGSGPPRLARASVEAKRGSRPRAGSCRYPSHHSITTGAALVADTAIRIEEPCQLRGAADERYRFVRRRPTGLEEQEAGAVGSGSRFPGWLDTGSWSPRRATPRAPRGGCARIRGTAAPPPCARPCCRRARSGGGAPARPEGSAPGGAARDRQRHVVLAAFGMELREPVERGREVGRRVGLEGPVVEGDAVAKRVNPASRSPR